jgi:hypothetical protein
VFAICEYVGVFLNIAYHGCAFFDIRYKVLFSVRIVGKNEEEEKFAIPQPIALLPHSDKQPEFHVELRRVASG